MNSTLSIHKDDFVVETQKYSELFDKPRRLLARRRRHSQATCAICKMRDRRGKFTTDMIDINKCFAQLYEE